jgi:hypothetical protein
MNDMRKGWSGTAIAARVVAVVLVLVLACLAPQGMEARAPMPPSGGGSAPPAGLSAGDWAAIQARLTQAGAHAPLVTGEVAKLTAGDAAAGDDFGLSVAVSGDTVVVGAYGDNSVAGAAYVFARNYDPGNPGTPLADNWGQVRKLTAADAATYDYFGYSVAISGDTVVVGAWADDDAGESSGSAYVFERNQDGPDHWGQVRKLAASDGAKDDQFGYSVAVSGDTVVVGAHENDLTGSVYVFERNYDPIHPGTPLADNWGEVRKLTASDAMALDYFGWAVAISGDTVVVGAWGDDDAGGWSGSAYVFARNYDPGDPGTPLADNWGQVRKLTASDAAAGDDFGLSVAISGDTVVVGADEDDDSGSAYVFERNYDPGDPGTPLADNWGEVRKLTAGDAAADDHFGDSVAISGDTVVVGAWANDDAGESSGSAYLFERNQGGPDGWGQVAKLTASDTVAGDEFSESVAISGNMVVIGVPEDDDAGNASGSAYVFARWGAAWVQQQKPTASTAGDHFGTSVAVSGDAFIAGAPGRENVNVMCVFYRNEGGAERWGYVSIQLGPGGSGFGDSVSISGDTAVIGAPDLDLAYVLERNDSGADAWGNVRVLYGAGGSGFGNSVSISGDTVVVGAPYDDVACSNCGAAYVFERNLGGADNWGLRAVLTGYLPEAGDGFGRSVAISGDTVVVGAPNDTYFGKSHVGSVYVFKRNYDADHPGTPKADNWGLARYVTSSDAAEWDLFGLSVAISGDTFVVGAPGDDNYTGAAYVFERNHFGWEDWSQVERLTADDGVIGDFFGCSVGIGGDTVVVGAPLDDDGGDGSGSAYLFKRNAGGADAWGQVEKLTADDAAEDDWFGYSVAISGNTVVVGAPYDDDGGNESGSTYVFRWAAAEVYLPLVLKD